MSRQAPKADTPAAAEPAPAVKVEEGTVDNAAVNNPAEPKSVSKDTFGNQIEEL